MGTSVGMIEAHYGALLDTAHEAILDCLNATVGVRPEIHGHCGGASPAKPICGSCSWSIGTPLG